MPSKKARMSEWLRGRSFVTAEDFTAVQTETGGTEGYLRVLLRQSGVGLHPLVEGVRQESFAELERTLLAMRDEPAYRRLVLMAKEHARLALRSPKVDAVAKKEMLIWMTVWLETPALFPQWLALRKRAAIANRSPQP